MTKQALTPMERSVLTALSVSPMALTWRDLSEILYSDREDGGPLYANTNIRLFIKNLRSKRGLQIECGPRRAYRLTDADRAKLREIAA